MKQQMIKYYGFSPVYVRMVQKERNATHSVEFHFQLLWNSTLVCSTCGIGVVCTIETPALPVEVECGVPHVELRSHWNSTPTVAFVSSYTVVHFLSINIYTCMYVVPLGFRNHFPFQIIVFFLEQLSTKFHFKQHAQIFISCDNSSFNPSMLP